MASYSAPPKWAFASGSRTRSSSSNRGTSNNNQTTAIDPQRESFLKCRRDQPCRPNTAREYSTAAAPRFVSYHDGIADVDGDDNDVKEAGADQRKRRKRKTSKYFTSCQGEYLSSWSSSSQVDDTQANANEHHRHHNHYLYQGYHRPKQYRASSISATARDSPQDLHRTRPSSMPNLRPFSPSSEPQSQQPIIISYQTMEPKESSRIRTRSIGAAGHHHHHHQVASMTPTPATASSLSSSSDRSHGDRECRRESSRLKSWLAYFKSIELENKGSVARDHLAVERTFLAWLRTSLAFASIGIAITQLFQLKLSLSMLNTDSLASNSGGIAAVASVANIDETNQRRAILIRSLGRPLGTTFLVVSIISLLLGTYRYFQIQHFIVHGQFPASRGSILVVAAVAFSLTMASLAVVVIA